MLGRDGVSQWVGIERGKGVTGWGDLRIVEVGDISYTIQDFVGGRPAEGGGVGFRSRGNVVSGEVEDEFPRSIVESFPVED